MFQIFVDSAANIPAVETQKYNINVIPFINHIGGKEVPGFEPGLTPEEERARGHEYYEAIRKGLTVKTSLVNSAAFMEHFRKVLAAGEDILYFSLSKNISGTFNAARLAADALTEEFPDRRIFLVDSLNASLAQGILAIYASEMRAAGKALSKIAADLSDMAHRMNGIFTVEDLKYLALSGRLSNVKAFIANALNIKPLLKGSKDGYIVQFRNCHGRKKALRDLIDLVCENAVDPANQIIGIAHADAYEDSLYVMQKIRERIPLRGFINTSYDYCTGAHVGPGTIALFFLGKDREL